VGSIVDGQQELYFTTLYRLNGVLLVQYVFLQRANVDVVHSVLFGRYQQGNGHPERRLPLLQLLGFLELDFDEFLKQIKSGYYYLITLTVKLCWNEYPVKQLCSDGLEVLVKKLFVESVSTPVAGQYIL
jgi:hypothetical protein